ncbi:MAG: GAF domain-containing protein [candidate division Zixibacteria bacterium]|nr:GAF domain-containing protein [candidate division Zixibacteria bacterium]
MADLWNHQCSVESLMNQPTYQKETPYSDTKIDPKGIDTLLRQTIAKLSRFFSIEKASLSHFNPNQNNLHVTHIYKRRRWNTGLTLIIQNNNSNMYQVLMQGYPVADNYPDHISSNIIERKIILSERTKSVLIIPLMYDCQKVGLLTLSSESEGAFGTYIDGLGEGIVAELTAGLYINQAFNAA